MGKQVIQMTYVAEPQKIDKSHIESRIQDWKNRLNALFAKFETWVPADPGIRILHGSLKQQEQLMKEYGVRPVEMPTFTILVNKNRIAFIPHSLWVIGANGRVNITTTKS